MTTIKMAADKGHVHHEPEVPQSGAIFTFGKSKFAENAPSKFWIKRDQIIAMSCGDEHTAVVTHTGRLFTFGSNEFGQLGLGHNNNVLKPSCVKVLKPDKVLAVACGKAHTVVAMASGRLWSFGSNAEGQLGIGPNHQDSVNVPTLVQFSFEMEAIVALEAGNSHTLALGQTGAVYVWGSNKEGQLGLGAEGEESLFVPTKLSAFMESGGPCKSISCGYYHSAIISDQGGLYTFGEADGGKLGLGDATKDADVPTPVDSIQERVCRVSCGGDHTLVLTESGDVYSFGTSSNGQLGLGTRILESAEPLKIASISGHHTVVGISCGENHTALVTQDGKLLTFGDGRHGKLCLDVETLTNHYTPVPSSRFRGFQVENAVCGGCHTMVQARPIPGYLPSSGPAEGGGSSSLQDDFNLPNGQHLEEINLEARRRHREEKLPPLAKNSSQDLEASGAEADSHPTQNNQEDDAEKILTIEQVEEQEIETKENEKNSKKGHKISNFFKNLGRKKAPEENGETLEEEEEDENESSPSKQKKQVRFFGRNKNKAEESKKEEESKDNEEDKSEGSDKDEEASDEDKSEDNEDEDEVSSIDEEPIKEESQKAKKHVTINEDIKSDSDQKNSPSNQRKKSRACSIL